MEVDNIAPVATSPLDSSRGRGNLRISTPKRRKARKQKQSTAYVAAEDAQFRIILVVPETPHTLGLTHVK
jgi:hypothetical protein